MTSLAITFSLLTATAVRSAEVDKRREAAGADRIVRPAMPTPTRLAGGGVLVPSALKIIPTLELDRAEVTNPLDRDAGADAANGALSPNLVGANVRANNTAGDASTTTNSENAIAMLGNFGVTGWNDGLNFGVSPGNSGYATTTDGGLTWLDGGVPPAVSPARYEGDPSLAVDNAGNFYYANLYTPGGGASAISVNHGKFTGFVFSWDPPVMPVGSTLTDFLDKEWIAVDPVNGNVYLTYTRFLAAGGNQIEFTRSINSGVTWDPPTALTSPVVENCQGSRVVVGPTGEIQVIYFVYDYASGNNYMRTRRSTTSGTSFGAEVTLPTGPSGVLSNYGSGPPGFNRNGGIGFPSLAIDRTAGLNSGRVYATWEETFNYYTDPLGALGPIAETEGNGSSATANPITIGQQVTGTMSSGADQDWFSFAGTAGDRVILYLVPGTGDGFLRLFAGGGATANRSMFSYLGGGQALVVYTLPSTATYYFRVLDASGGSSGTYSVYTGPDLPNPGDEVGLDTRDAIFQTSPDGVTWAPRKVVNDEAKRYDNAWPEVAVDACGMVYVDWMDHRVDAANGILNDVYYSSSSSAGTVWNPSIKVNDGASVNWNLVGSNLQPNMGDYWNLVGDGINLYANFADGRQGSPDSWVAKISECVPTATQVSLVSVQADPGRVTLRWYASGAAALAATVQRRASDGDWQLLGNAHVESDGMISFVDQAVTGGRRYEYRLGVDGGYAGLVEVEVPVSATFALQRLGRNPANGDLDVSFSLPSSAAATLELLDVGGRSLRRVAVGGKAGTGVARLGARGSVPPGFYLARLTQGANTVSMKVIVVGQ